MAILRQKMTQSGFSLTMHDAKVLSGWVAESLTLYDVSYNMNKAVSNTDAVEAFCDCPG